MKAILPLLLGFLLVSSAYALSKTSTDALAPITPDTPNDEPQSNTDSSSGPVEADAVDEMTADTVMPSPNEVLTDLDLHSHKQTQTQTSSTQATPKLDTSTPSLLEKDDEMDALDSTLEDASSGLSEDKDSFTEPDGISALTHHMTNVRFRSQHEPAATEEHDDSSKSYDMDATLDAMDPALDLNAELDSSLNVDDADDTGDMDETAFLEMQHMELFGADLRGPERTTPEKAAMDSAAQEALMDADSSDTDDSDTADEQDSDMGLDLDAEDAMDLVDANMDDATDKDFDSFLNEAINVGTAGLPNPVITAGSSVAEESK